MAERDLGAPGHRQAGQPGRAAGRRVSVGQQQAEREIGHRVIERLMDDVHRLEPAEGERPARPSPSRPARSGGCAHRRRSPRRSRRSAATTTADTRSRRPRAGRAASWADRRPRRGSRRPGALPARTGRSRTAGVPRPGHATQLRLDRLVHLLGVAAQRREADQHRRHHDPPRRRPPRASTGCRSSGARAWVQSGAGCVVRHPQDRSQRMSRSILTWSRPQPRGMTDSGERRTEARCLRTPPSALRHPGPQNQPTGLENRAASWRHR